jgi:hypothetical protein
MTRQEAREILLLYRPDHPDPDDENFEEALELAKRDPELAAWFEQHCAAQKAFARAFRQIEVAEGLKEQILSERKARFSPKLRRTAVALCAIAAIVVAVITMLPRSPSPGPASDGSFRGFREQMAGDVQRLYPRMDLMTNDLAELRQYLAQHRGHAEIAVPKPLVQAVPAGCAILSWQGKRVSMLCFNSSQNAGAAVPDLYLLVIKRSDVKTPPENTQPEVKLVNGLATASWTAGENAYVLGGLRDEAFLKKYL